MTSSSDPISIDHFYQYCSKDYTCASDNDATINQLDPNSIVYDSDYDTTSQPHDPVFKFNNAVFNLNTRKIRDFYPNESTSLPLTLPTKSKDLKQMLTNLHRTSCTRYVQLSPINLNHLKFQVNNIITAIIPNPNHRVRLLHMLARSLIDQGNQQYVHVWTGDDVMGKVILLKLIKETFGNYCNDMDVAYLAFAKRCKTIATNRITISSMCRLAITNQPTHDVLLKPIKLLDMYTNPQLTNAKFNIIIPTQRNITIDTNKSKELDVPIDDVLKLQSFDQVDSKLIHEYINVDVTRDVAIAFFHILLDHCYVPSCYLQPYDHVTIMPTHTTIDTFLRCYCVLGECYKMPLSDLYLKYRTTCANPVKSSIFTHVMTLKGFKIKWVNDRVQMERGRYWMGIGLQLWLL
ncbi:Hypothetical protein MVR_LOCUS350 [uncultured virus]|nr:Hypothetical protein MVR_LOCUS350 [uncultured virus]